MKPPIDEHAAIVRALKRRDPDAARTAMQKHISRVLERLLEHTEVREMQRVRETAAEKRRLYASKA
jgi:DNA-binding GntR family transcriptional regulator